jgi:hypothetical protein
VWEKPIDDTDYSVHPFTVRAIDDNVKIRFNKPYKYSINGGEWLVASTQVRDEENVSISYNEITVNKNDIVSIITTKESLLPYRFRIIGLSDIYGNIMSLVYGDNFIGKTVWKRWGAHEYTTESGFFRGSDIRSAKNLILPAEALYEYSYIGMFKDCVHLIAAPKILPATVLSTGCYAYMFYGCSSLLTAPELPATTLKYRCYIRMFENCTSLIYIKCKGKSVSNRYDGTYVYFSDCVDRWMDGISTNGTIHCVKLTDGKLWKNYIPSTWTVEYMD